MNLPALTDDHYDRLDFEEDMMLLEMLRNKLFRRAISGGVELVEPGDIEKQALNAIADLSLAVAELDAARAGLTDVHVLLASLRGA